MARTLKRNGRPPARVSNLPATGAPKNSGEVTRMDASGVPATVEGEEGWVPIQSYKRSTVRNKQRTGIGQAIVVSSGGGERGHVHIPMTRRIRQNRDPVQYQDASEDKRARTSAYGAAASMLTTWAAAARRATLEAAPRFPQSYCCTVGVSAKTGAGGIWV